MAIHSQPISAYVESEIPEGMTLGAYRVRKQNRREVGPALAMARVKSVHGTYCICHLCQLEQRARYGGNR